MEITYFSLAITEIILTSFLIFLFIKAEKRVNDLREEFKLGFEAFYLKFKKFSLALSCLNKILKLQDDLIKEAKKLKKFYKTYKNFKSAFIALAVLLGFKAGQKLNLKSLLKLF